MPTYRNDGSVAKEIKDITGAMRSVAPGGTVEVYELQTDSDLTLTAETPYWSPASSRWRAVTPTGIEVRADEGAILYKATLTRPGYYPSEEGLPVKGLPKKTFYLTGTFNGAVALQYQAGNADFFTKESITSDYRKVEIDESVERVRFVLPANGGQDLDAWIYAGE